MRRHKGLYALIFLAVLAIASAVIMLLWNAIIPSVIGWGTLGYWQALGLIVICRVLFGGLGRMLPRRRHYMARTRTIEDGDNNDFDGFRRGHHRHFAHMHEELYGMTREERREYIREHMGAMHEFHHGRGRRGGRGGENNGCGSRSGEGMGRKGGGAGRGHKSRKRHHYNRADNINDFNEKRAEPKSGEEKIDDQKEQQTAKTEKSNQ